MANVLKMTMIEAIQSLRSAGLSCREIARRLGIDRGTVSRRLSTGHGRPVQAGRQFKTSQRRFSPGRENRRIGWF